MKDLVPVEEKTAVELYSSEEGLSSIVQEARDFVADFTPDLTTVKGRAEITSLASKVARFKGKLDDYGKDLGADWKLKLNAVNANRKKMRDELDALKVIARQPLTDWEAEQEAREAAEEAEQARIEQERVDEELAENLRKQIEQDHEMGLLLDEKHDRDAQVEADSVAREAQEQAAREEQQRKDQIEADRVADLERKMLVFTRYQTNSVNTTTVDQWTEALEAVRSIEMTVEQWEDYLPAATQAQTEATAGLEGFIQQRTKYDADQVQLKILQEEKVERERQAEVDRQLKIITDRETAAAIKKADNRNHQRAINVGIVKAMVELGASEELAQTIVESIARKNIENIVILY